MEKDGNVSTVESVERLEFDVANKISKKYICKTEFNKINVIGERDEEKGTKCVEEQEDWKVNKK